MEGQTRSTAGTRNCERRYVRWVIGPVTLLGAAYVAWQIHYGWYHCVLVGLLNLVLWPVLFAYLLLEFWLRRSSLRAMAATLPLLAVLVLAPPIVLASRDYSIRFLWSQNRSWMQEKVRPLRDDWGAPSMSPYLGSSGVPGGWNVRRASRDDLTSIMFVYPVFLEYRGFLFSPNVSYEAGQPGKWRGYGGDPEYVIPMEEDWYYCVWH